MQGLKHLFGYRVTMLEATLGRVEDFFVDEESWMVRYLVVRTGGILSNKRALIPAGSLGAPDPDRRRLPVTLHGDQVVVEDEDEVRTVSAEMEERLQKAYGNSVRRDRGQTRGGSGPIPVLRRAEGAKGSSLRSVREVGGYQIETVDGSCGLCTDVLADPEGWRAPYLVVNTKEWHPHGHVLVPTVWVREVSWEEMEFRVAASRSKVQRAQRFDPASHSTWSPSSAYPGSVSA